MLYLLNTTIMPNEGVYVNRKVSLTEVEAILETNPTFTSALGHQGSADAFNSLFPRLNCEVNRIPATMQPGDEAIALKVLGRLPEGQILSLTELEAIGFEFFQIKMVMDVPADPIAATVEIGAKFPDGSGAFSSFGEVNF